MYNKGSSIYFHFESDQELLSPFIAKQPRRLLGKGLMRTAVIVVAQTDILLVISLQQ